MFLSEQFHELVFLWCKELDRFNWYLMSTYPPNLHTWYVVLEYDDSYGTPKYHSHSMKYSTNLTVSTSKVKVFTLAIRSLFTWDWYSLVSLLGCSLMCFIFIRYGIRYCKDGVKVIVNTSRTTDVSFSLSNSTDGSSTDGAASEDSDEDNYGISEEISSFLNKLSSTNPDDIDHSSNISPAHTIEESTMCPGKEEEFTQLAEFSEGIPPTRSQVEVEQQFSAISTRAPVKSHNRNELNSIANNTQLKPEKYYIEDFESTNVSLMDLVEFKENIKTKQNIVSVHVPETINSSKIVLVEANAGENIHPDKSIAGTGDTLQNRVVNRANSPLAVTKCKKHELDPRLKAILVSNKEFDPVDFFDLNGVNDVNFTDFDITNYLKSQFNKDLMNLTHEFVDLLRFLICNEYEGEKAGLFDYINEIKSNLVLFINNIRNLDCSINIVYLIRDIITYAEDEAIDLQTVNLFINTIFDALDIIPLSVVSLSVCVVLCSLNLTDFTDVFLHHFPSRSEVMLQCLKYYVCFNQVDSVDQKFILEILLSVIPKASTVDLKIINELMDIFWIFKEKNSLYLETQLTILESLIG